MIDIHNHILPGVDDGSKNIEMSLEMLRTAHENGTSKLIITPHYIKGSIENTSDKIKTNLKLLEEKVREAGLNLKLYPGSEIFLEYEIIEMLKKGELQSLNDSKYLLIEFPMDSVPLYVEDVLYQLQILGYVPIIAHPERNRKLREDINKLFELIEKGMLSQVNSSSICGLHGKEVQNAANQMIEHNLVHFISSDAHSNRGRSPNMKECYNLINKKFGEERALELLELNSKKVIENELIISDEPIKFVKKGFFSFFKK